VERQIILEADVADVPGQHEDRTFVVQFDRWFVTRTGSPTVPVIRGSPTRIGRSPLAFTS